MRPIVLAACGAVLTASLYACGDNSATFVVNTATPAAAATPFTSTSSSTLSAGAPNALPAVSGFSGTVTLPAGSTVAAGTTLQIALSQNAPTGVTAIQLRRMTSAPTTLFYMSLTASAAVSVSAGTTLSVSVPAALAATGTSFYIDCFNSTTKAWNECAGPATASSSGTVSLTLNSGFAMAANTPIYLSLESTSGGSVIVQTRGR